MKAVIQRVKGARVIIDGIPGGEINQGLVILLGIGEGDNLEIAKKMVDKIAAMRIFEDDAEKMNLSVQDINGSVMIISQFTLYADCHKGNRPNFMAAAKPDIAKPLYLQFIELMGNKGISVKTGEFGADMQVELCNDGPVTIVLEM